MHNKICNKHFWICVLICSLILTSGTALIGASSNGYDLNHSFFKASDSSMSGSANLWQANDLVITSPAELLTLTAKHSPWLLSALAYLISAQIICLFNSSRLAGSLCSQFDSIQIALFLHDTDGMK